MRLEDENSVKNVQNLHKNLSVQNVQNLHQNLTNPRSGNIVNVKFKDQTLLDLLKGEKFLRRQTDKKIEVRKVRKVQKVQEKVQVQPPFSPLQPPSPSSNLTPESQEKSSAPKGLTTHNKRNNNNNFSIRRNISFQHEKNIISSFTENNRGMNFGVKLKREIHKSHVRGHKSHPPDRPEVIECLTFEARSTSKQHGSTEEASRQSQLGCSNQNFEKKCL